MWSRPSGTLAFLSAPTCARQWPQRLATPTEGDSRQSPRRWPGENNNTVRSQSSEVAYLHSENRFLYDGSLFFLFFFLIPFKNFFILKSEGEKKVCKQVGAPTTGSPKSSHNPRPSACFRSSAEPSIPYKYLWPQFNNSFFSLTLYSKWKNGAILW